MRASDLAYLAALVEDEAGRNRERGYPRREGLLEELQRAFRAASSLNTKRLSIRVLTSWGERKGLKEPKEHGEHSK